MTDNFTSSFVYQSRIGRAKGTEIEILTLETATQHTFLIPLLVQRSLLTSEIFSNSRSSRSQASPLLIIFLPDEKKRNREINGKECCAQSVALRSVAQMLRVSSVVQVAMLGKGRGGGDAPKFLIQSVMKQHHFTCSKYAAGKSWVRTSEAV